MGSQNEVLSGRGIVKSFGATRALRGVDFVLREGEIHALLGGNGAGKSTLIKILSGELTADEGHPEGGANGVAVVHQELTIMKDLSVSENLFLGFSRGWRSFPWGSAAAASTEVLATLELDDGTVTPRTPAGSLPLHKLQLLEIGRALASKARVVLLDEPTAALTSQETEVLFGVLRRLRSDGMSFIFVSHRMEEIRQIADRMTILRDGTTAVNGIAVDDISDAEVLTQMFGETHRTEHAKQVQTELDGQATVVELRHPSLPEQVVIRQGEVVGLAGAPVGPQRLLNTILGVESQSPWQVELCFDRRAGSAHSPRDAITRGVGYVSGDRGDKGVFPELSIYDNTLAARQVVSRSVFNPPAARREVDKQAARLGFAHQDLTQPPSSLSGGTQQKFLLARWLDLPVRLLLLEEPTRGVDLHTKTDLYRIVEEIAEAGCAVIWWSTEYAELKQTCDRVLAFNVTGEPVDVLPMHDIDEEDLLSATGTT